MTLAQGALGRTREFLMAQNDVQTTDEEIGRAHV